MEKLMDELTVMKEAAVKKTQEMLGQVIKKPVLMDKLLKRPPFRYLHDIITEVIRTTGFMKGLYDENEMNSDNVQDKQSKIAFLQKAIDVVTLVSGKALAARPVYIVAGYQPEKTNELLQAIAECCLDNLPSGRAVKQVLGENKVDLKTSTSTSKEKRKKYERILTREERRNVREHSPVTSDPHQMYCAYRSGEQAQDGHRGRDKDRPQAEERERGRGREKDKHTRSQQEMTRDRVSPRDLDRAKKQQRRTEQQHHKDGKEEHKSANRKRAAAVSAEPGCWCKTAEPGPASDIPVGKTQRSAPAAPRVKSRKAPPGVTSPGRPLPATHPVPIILDRDGEDKQRVKQGAVRLIPPAADAELELSPSFQNSTEHNWLFDAAWAKEEDEAAEEVECLHSSVRKLCRSFLPLGKSMDNIQGDIEDMVAECHTWREENKKHARALLEERRVTDLTLQPLKAELAEVEQLIADQLSRVHAVKSSIQKNEEKILKVVMGLNISC